MGATAEISGTGMQSWISSMSLVVAMVSAQRRHVRAAVTRSRGRRQDNTDISSCERNTKFEQHFGASLKRNQSRDGGNVVLTSSGNSFMVVVRVTNA